MNHAIALPLKPEHEALHGQCRQATPAGGEVGELATILARLMQHARRQGWVRPVLPDHAMGPALGTAVA